LVQQVLVVPLVPMALMAPTALLVIPALLVLRVHKESLIHPLPNLSLV
jgi:hypothetical protein